jgi:hypothetical protein
VERLVTGVLGKNHRKGGDNGKTALVDTAGHLHVAPLSPVSAPLIARNPVRSSSGIRAVPDQSNTVIDSTVVEAGWILEDSLAIMGNIFFDTGRRGLTLFRTLKKKKFSTYEYNWKLVLA